MLAQESTDLDAHTVRLSGFWFYSQPYGSFHGSGNQGGFDFHADAEFWLFARFAPQHQINKQSNWPGLDSARRSRGAREVSF